MPTTASEVQRIDDQIERAYRQGAWSGPTVLETLFGVSTRKAAARPIGDAHSIWEITVHIGVWKDVVTRRLKGEVVSSVPPDQDWPPVTDTSAAAWKRALADLEARHQALRKVVAGIRDEQLDQPATKGGSSRYVQLHGVIQHDLYHAGQIALLRKG